MAHICMIGNCVLDLIQTTPSFPHPNAEIRAQKLDIRRGGNAANSLQILARLGHQCQLLATLADDLLGRWLQQQLQQQGIEIDQCPLLADCHAPLSTILLQAQSPERCIVHYRDLPELSPQQIRDAKLGTPDWLHLEGRNVEVLSALLPEIRHKHLGPISLELEKNRTGLALLLAWIDVAVIANDWVESQAGGAAALESLQQQYPHCQLIWTRGAQGLSALIDGEWLHIEAQKVDVVDSNGAGDSFLAGLIHARLKGLNWRQSLQEASALAACKIQYPGLDRFPVENFV